ncbi:hypothetical protein V1477_018092 [Vespula maculifrons]|uniref:Uncharacterized protein n=1 Tax=Vespula maculifrons TaxID=7453 RepID=A0ABD2B074_VESMC
MNIQIIAEVLFSERRWYPFTFTTSILFSGGNERQALNMFSIAARCLNNAFITGVPFGTNGALHKYESIERTLSKPRNSSSFWSMCRKVIREQSSASNTKSKMIGLASKESSHVLCITISFVFNIPTYGTYLITTQ